MPSDSPGPEPLLLTGNARLAADLRSREDQRHAGRGEAAWRPSQIFALDDWLERAWQQAQLFSDRPDARLLLSPPQEQMLWEGIIAADGVPLLDLGATGGAAAAAYALVHAWQLDWRDAAWTQSEDTEAFRRWAAAFDRRCADAGWLPRARLIETLLPDLAAAPGCRYAGFDQLTPRQQQLFDRLGAAPQPAPAQVAKPRLVAAADPESELALAAAWAREQMEAGHARIAVIVPELEPVRAAAERIFTREFHPTRAPWDTAPRAFNLSLGRPLGSYPLVGAALRLLDLSAGADEPLDWPALSALLLSPFLAGAAAERSLRAGLEVELRRNRQTVLTLKALADRAAPTARQLAAALRRWHNAIPPASRVRSFSEWVEVITKLLTAAGWPGETPLDSAEFQTRAAWDDLLATLATLDQVGGPETFAAAAARLRQLAFTRIFQPQSSSAPVQILGWIEAAGLDFDALWVLGLDDATLPRGPSPSAFLPWAAQRDRQLPRATAAGEAQFARRRLDALLAAAPRVTLSHARRNAEGDIELGPSPLLAGYGAAELRAVAVGLPAALVCETVDEPRLAAGAGEYRAGAALFTDQSACAFRAFARHRLRAGAPPPVPWGLDAATRGDLVHHALQSCWRELGSHAGLLAASMVALDALLRRAVTEALENCGPLRALPWLRDAESARLLALLRAWIEVERGREAFVVEATEEVRELEFAGLQLHLRLDRVDRIRGPEGESRLLIDYKTGVTPLSGWIPPYLAAPQLPLYAVTSPAPPPDGIAIATLRPGELKLARLDGTSKAPPHFKARGFGEMPWPDRLQAWRTELEARAADYLAGEAGVLPRHTGACTHCDLTALCRIRESDPFRETGVSESDEEAAGDGGAGGDEA